jgi:hypothetical protein
MSALCQKRTWGGAASVSQNRRLCPFRPVAALMSPNRPLPSCGPPDNWPNRLRGPRNRLSGPRQRFEPIVKPLAGTALDRVIVTRLLKSWTKPKLLLSAHRT